MRMMMIGPSVMMIDDDDDDVYDDVDDDDGDDVTPTLHNSHHHHRHPHRPHLLSFFSLPFVLRGSSSWCPLLGVGVCELP